MIPRVKPWFVRWRDDSGTLVAVARIDTPTRQLARIIARDIYSLWGYERTITRRAPASGPGDPAPGQCRMLWRAK